LTSISSKTSCDDGTLSYSPDAEGLAAAEGRRSRELDEAAFESAAERYDEE
jgi:hypothetical protein